MSELQRIVTIIPAKPLVEQEAMKRRLRVAAYGRVSTEEEEQQSSYEAQCSYYTEKIMSNPEWVFAGMFADEGITGTSTKKRDDFNRMIRKCKQGKLDLILTKSISRFARNTLDTIKYTRLLRAKAKTPSRLCPILTNRTQKISVFSETFSLLYNSAITHSVPSSSVTVKYAYEILVSEYPFCWK